ncbi:hypothetical protein LIER_24210 [Lithospermum erythrorhizon]|uniref:Uncharacterized protein n=1 Tax=Lithospermum erythrorhizon TaxID=34254 RepID=A0AAV3R2H4_LITER
MEVGSTSRGTVGPIYRVTSTLEVPEESPRKGLSHEEIRSFPFDKRDPKKVFMIVKEKKWAFSKEKGEAIREEVGKLMGANAMRELLFPT